MQDVALSHYAREHGLSQWRGANIGAPLTGRPRTGTQEDPSLIPLASSKR
jgi:hypothetical protein